jgi:hypothetical protein
MGQAPRSIVLAALMAAGLPQTKTTLIEWTHGVPVTELGNSRGVRSDRGPTIPAQDYSAPASSIPHRESDAQPRTMTPLGGLLPPHQLTPAPLLPFHPNRPLIPPPSVPGTVPGARGPVGH